MIKTEKLSNSTKPPISKFFNTKILTLKTNSNTLLILYFLIYSIQHFLLTFQCSIELHKVLSISKDYHILQVPQFIIGLYQVDLENTEQLMKTIIGFLALYILFLAFLLLYLLSCYFRTIQISASIGNCFRFLLDLHLFVLSQPIFNFLIKLVFNVGSGGDPTAKGLLIFGIIFLIIISTLFSGLSVLANLITLEQSIIERSNNYIFGVEFLTNLLNGGYLAYCLSNPEVGFKPSFSYLNAFSNFVELAILMYSVPFFTKKVMNLALIFHSAGAGLSIANILVSEALSELGFIIESIIILAIIISALILKTVIVFLNDDLPHEIMDKTNLRIVNEYWMIRRIKLFLETLRNSEHKFDILAQRQNRNVLIVHSNRGLLHSGHTEQKREVYSFSENLMNSLKDLVNSKEYSSNFKLWILKILAEQQQSVMQVYSLIQKNLITEKKILISFGLMAILERIKFFMHVNFAASEKKGLMVDYLESIKTKNKLYSRVQQFFSLQKILFSMLEVYNPDLQEIDEIVTKLALMNFEIQKIWHRVPSNLWEINPEILKIYSSFIKNYDQSLYKALVLNYKSLITKHIPKINCNNNEIEIAINRKSGFLLVSLENIDFGKILLCTGNVTTYLKYSPGKLDGKSIQTIVPYFLYDSYIKKTEKHIENLLNSNELQSDFSVFLSAEGHLVPFEDVSYYLPIEGIGLCKWSYINFDKYRFEYMLIDGDGNVKATTKHIAQDLELKIESRHNLRELSEKHVTHGTISLISKTNLKKKINFLFPSNNSLMYRCEILESEYEGYYFLKGVKCRSKINKMIEVEGNTIFDYSQSKFFEPQEKTKSKIDLNGTFGAYSDTQEMSSVKKRNKRFINVNELIGLSKDDDSNIEEITHSDLTSRHYSYNQNSVHTAFTNFENREIGYRAILRSMKFTKNREKFIPIILTVIFFVFYIFAIRFSYAFTQDLINNLSERLDLFNLLSGRARFTMEICRNAYANLLYQNYYPNGSSYQRGNIQQMPLRLGNISKFNNNLRQSLNEIGDFALAARFFEKNVKMYDDEFLNLTNSIHFSIENSFTATNLLINQADILYRKALEEDDYQHYLMEYIMTNSFNDLSIENENLFNAILQDIIDEIEVTANLEESLLINTLWLLGFSFILYAVIIFISYKKTALFLSQFIDPSSKVLTLSLEKPSEENISDELSKKSKRKKNEIGAHKMPKRNKLFKSFLKKYLMILIFLVMPEIMHILNHFNIITNIQNCREHLVDVKNLNNIRMNAIFATNLQMMAIVYPDGYSFYSRNIQNFEKKVKELDSYISINVGFSEQALSLLQADLCNFYLSTFIRPKCNDLSKGVAHQGVTSTILSVQTYLIQLSKKMELAGRNLSLLTTYILEPEFLDNYYLISNALSPAVEIFQERFTGLLHEELDSTFSKTLVLFICGVGSAIALIIVIVYVFWVLIGGKMVILSELVRLVPLEYLVTNRELKSYLLKESKEANMFFKMIEKRQK